MFYRRCPEGEGGAWREAEKDAATAKSEIVTHLIQMLEEASENDDMSKITQLNEALTIFIDNIVITKSPDLDDNNDKEDDEYKIPDDLPNDIDSEVDENE